MASDIVDQVVDREASPSNFLSSWTKVQILRARLNCWLLSGSDSDNTMEHIFLTFFTLTDFMEQTTRERETQQHIIAHFERMSVEFESCFPFLTAVSDGSPD
jgi:hypothetical protein